MLAEEGGPQAPGCSSGLPWALLPSGRGCWPGIYRVGVGLETMTGCMSGDSPSSIAGVAPEPSSIRQRGSKGALGDEAACGCKNTRAELQWEVLRGG